MGTGPADLRTSGKDVLALGLKVSSLLQRYANRLTEEMEHGDLHFSLEEDALKAEECQQAIDLHGQIQEGMMTLRTALKDAEDAEDHDLSRLLREPVDSLQTKIRKALQIASTVDGGAKKVPTTGSFNRTAPSSTAAPAGAPLNSSGRSHPIPMSTSGNNGNPSGGKFSIHHNVGLYSTSPKFPGGFPTFTKLGTSPFRSSMEAERRSSLEQTIFRDDDDNNINTNNNEEEQEEETTPMAHKDKGKQRAVSPDPLAELFLASAASASTPMSTKAKSASKPITKPAAPKPVTSNETKATVTSTPSAGFDPLSSFMAKADAAAAANESKSSPPQSKASPTIKKQPASAASSTRKPPAAKGSASATATHVSSSSATAFNRRVPRGLFSSSISESASTPEAPRPAAAPASIPPPGPSTLSWTASLEPPPDISSSPQQLSRPSNKLQSGPNGSIVVISPPEEPVAFAQGHGKAPTGGQSLTVAVEDPMPRRSRLSRHLASTNSPTSPSFPPTPVSASSPTSPTTPRSVTTSSSQRPTPIRTKLPSSSNSSLASKANQEERLSKLVEDLDRAMNPTPTDSVPEHTFLQGSTLVLLPNDDDEENDVNQQNANGSDDVGYIRIGGGSTLRRQRSVGRKGLKILTRSRSRSRSRPGRSNSTASDSTAPVVASTSKAGGTFRRSKHPPQPIAIGTVPMPIMADGVGAVGGGWALSSSSTSANNAGGAEVLARRREGGPFASEVAVSHPVRIGRGIGSFTVYTITLTLSEALSSSSLSSVAIVTTGGNGAVSSHGNQTHLRQREQHAERMSGSDNTFTSAGNDCIPDTGVIGVVADERRAASSAPESPASTSIPHDDRSSTQLFHARPPTSKASAAMLMTRSLSFPELSSSAVRLLQECQSYEQEEYSRESHTNHYRSALSLSASPSFEGGDQAHQFPVLTHARAATTTGMSEGEDAWRRHFGTLALGADGVGLNGSSVGLAAGVTATTRGGEGGPLRIIQVRKRYSDFVILRAKIVATFKEPKKSKLGKGKAKTNATVAASGASSLTTPPPLNATSNYSSSSGASTPTRRPNAGRRSASYMSTFSNNSTDYTDEDDEEEDDDYSDVPYPSQQQQHSRTTTTPVTWVNLAGLPKLPPKKVVGKFKPEFVEKRRRDLEYFLQWVVAHPILGQSAVVVQWFLES